MPLKNQRRSHTKSKKGCSQCKVRRIKCDEVHPICANCERRQIECDFSRPGSVTSPPLRRPSSTGTESVGTASNTAAAGAGIRDHGAIDPFSLPNLVSNTRSSDLNISDLELLHNFTAIVAVEMASNNTPEALALWQTHAVLLGFKHEFLLRGILAVSAFHLSYHRPAMKAEYDLKASAHQELALQACQETLTDVNETNCHALFAFSCLIVLMAFASSAKNNPDDFQVDVLQWFHLIRGCNSVLAMHREALETSFLSPLLDEMRHIAVDESHPIPDADRILDLIPLCCTAAQDRDVSQAYALAIHDLLRTFVQASTLRGADRGFLLASFVWPVTLSPLYLELLAEQKAEAMVILAHYCLLIHWATQNHDNWFLQGWARYMLDTIRQSVSEPWRDSIAWLEKIIV